MSLRVTDVKMLLGGRLVEGGISIQDGRISRIGKTLLLPKSETNIDGKGLIAIPGLIDAHVHLRDMELAYKEDFSSGTLAAAAGGFTTILDMPNTKPPTTSEERLREKIERAKATIHVNVGFYGALAESAIELRAMIHAGAIAFKLYMNEPNPEAWHHDPRRLLSSLEESASLGVQVACHAETGTQVAKIQRECQAEGKNSVRDFLRAHAPEFEAEAVRRITSLSRRVGASVHLCHMSTQRALKEISMARRVGTAVTCEATPHHLLLDQKDLGRKGGLAIMVPPLRKTSDARTLWRALAGGRVNVVASDHAPHSLEEKTATDVWAVKPGIPGLETTLPLLLTRVKRREISLNRIVQALAENPARIFGLQGKGRLAPGTDGDIVLINPKERFKIDSSTFYSKARFSPFDGLECVGRPVTTIVSGRIVYDRGEIVEKNRGEVVTSEVRPRSSSSTAC